MDEKHYLAPLFEPRTLAIIGATERADALGSVLVQNMLGAGFTGEFYAVNPKYKQVHGLPCYRDISKVPKGLDLAVIATPARSVPGILRECGRAGVKTAIVLSGGFGEIGPKGAALEMKAMQYAREYGMRVLGPNSMGLIRPSIGLNASFALGQSLSGSIGLISQSGALCAAIIDYARPNKLGFSNIVALGSSSNLDFGEVLDYMVWDRKTTSILLYIEGIRDARRFLSALRAAARAKPVMVLKVGRHPASQRAASAHSAAMAGDDAVFDAALRRAGVVRLASLSQLYAASKGLFTDFRPRGKRLAIITNGGGPGVMAADRACDLGIEIASLSPDTLGQLNKILPPEWSHANPVDLISDSDPRRYCAALEILLADANVDGVLCLLTPQAMTRPVEVARGVIELCRAQKKPVLTCWLGEEHCTEARTLFQAASIPSLRTPENAVELFHNLSNYYRNQQLLTQVAAPIADERPPFIEAARLITETAQRQGRSVLNRQEALAVLSAFHITCAPTQLAHSPQDAADLASGMGFPITLRPNAPLPTSANGELSPRRKLSNPESVAKAFEGLQNELQNQSQLAAMQGQILQHSASGPWLRELMLEVSQDPVFGPVIAIGDRSLDPAAWLDRSIALPPLNQFLARDLLQDTRAAARLHLAHDLPAAVVAAISTAMEDLLIKVSHLICELPSLHQLHINPIRVDARGVTVFDARFELASRSRLNRRYEHMAIHPYPASLIQRITLKDGRKITLRPLKPEDAEMEQNFVRQLSPETKYFRFMNAVRELPPSLLAKLTQIDYDREMAFIATITADDQETEVGVCRYASNPDGESCEFAIVIADEFQQSGLGRQMMQLLIDTAHDSGLKTMKGDFLAGNDRMLRFVRSFGFELHHDADDRGVVCGELVLGSAAHPT